MPAVIGRRPGQLPGPLPFRKTYNVRKRVCTCECISFIVRLVHIEGIEVETLTPISKKLQTEHLLDVRSAGYVLCIKLAGRN